MGANSPAAKTINDVLKSKRSGRHVDNKAHKKAPRARRKRKDSEDVKNALES